VETIVNIYKDIFKISINISFQLDQLWSCTSKICISTWPTII